MRIAFESSDRVSGEEYGPWDAFSRSDGFALQDAPIRQSTCGPVRRRVRARENVRTVSDAEAELAAALADPGVYFCPMDLDVRSNEPGFCPRCRMALVAGLPDPADYHMDLTLNPAVPRAGQTATLGFTVRDPWENRTVQDFEVMHERIFHLFVMSQDLEFFQHIHPLQDAEREGLFVDVELPNPGLYQVLADFYPVGGTPQLIAKSFIVPNGRLEAVELDADYTAPKQGENLQVELVTEPAVPIAGQETEMYFTVSPAEGLEEYIGAWGHMLAVSDDLIDTVHGHPVYCGRRSGDVVSLDVSAHKNLSRLGAVPAKRRREYGALRCPGRGIVFRVRTSFSVVVL